MDYMRKMPFIMGASAAIVIGIISYNNGYDLKAICVRMTAGMILFFAAGVLLRKVINSIYEEVKEKSELIFMTVLFSCSATLYSGLKVSVKYSFSW